MTEQLNDKSEAAEDSEHREIFSKVVRAGKRTYFFDVRATKRNGCFLTITESKKRFNKDGKFFFEKHKIFLYRDDFEKFADGIGAVIEFTRTVKTSEQVMDQITAEVRRDSGDYTSVDFEDLESVELVERDRKN